MRQIIDVSAARYRRLLAAAFAVLVLAQGVAIGADDPLALIGHPASSTSIVFRKMVLGIVFTDATKQAMVQAGEIQEKFDSIPIVNEHGKSEADITYLTRSVNAILQQRFKDVVVLDNFDQRHVQPLDAVMVLDITFSLGHRSGDTTKVDIVGTFVGDDQKPIGHVSGEGAAELGYPAWTFKFQPAADDAVHKFEQSLDGATDVAVALANAPGPETAASASSITNSVPEVSAVDGMRLALVIGNSNYREVSRLPNPANDARLVARTLHGLGFQVIQVVDGDEQTMKQTIDSFGTRLAQFGSQGIGLFYYAGHGIQARGHNYLVPVSAGLHHEADLDREAISIDWVMSRVQNAGDKLNIFILDACRNNPFPQHSRALSRGLARIDAPTGSFIAYSTAPDEIATDGDGSNGPYAQALAVAMTKPGVPIEETFKQVRIIVRKSTNGTQTPWESSSLTGNFYFAPHS